MKQLKITELILCAMGFLAVPAWGIDITEVPPEGEEPIEAIEKKEVSVEECTLTELPDELLAHILHYLPAIDLFRVRQVNHQMRTFLDDERFFGTVPEVPRSLNIGNAREVLRRAAREGWLSIVRLFIECEQAELNLRNNNNGYDNGNEALTAAVRHGQLAVIQYLVEHGAQVNLQNNDGNTALHYAAMNEHLAAPQYLVGLRAQVDLRDNHGDTALHFAAMRGQLDIAQYLVEQGADVHLRNHAGNTALQDAARYGQLDIAEYLDRRVAEVHLQNNNADTDLTEAASGNLLQAEMRLPLALIRLAILHSCLSSMGLI